MIPGLANGNLIKVCPVSLCQGLIIYDVVLSFWYYKFSLILGIVGPKTLHCPFSQESFVPFCVFRDCHLGA